MRFPVLASARDEARAALLPFLVRRRLRRRAKLDGALLNDRVALIWSGRYRLLADGRAGRRNNLQSLDPGQIAGIERLGAASNPAWAPCLLCADDDGIILTLTHKHFIAVADAHPALWRAVALANGARARALTVRLQQIATETVRDRVIAYLREAATRTGSTRLSPIPRQVNIAAEIGASREAVTRVMKMLAEEGQIVLGFDHLDLAKPSRTPVSPLSRPITITTRHKVSGTLVHCRDVVTPRD
jgi:CRP-like cAMP-binding protein